MIFVNWSVQYHAIHRWPKIFGLNFSITSIIIKTTLSTKHNNYKNNDNNHNNNNNDHHHRHYHHHRTRVDSVFLAHFLQISCWLHSFFLSLPLSSGYIIVIINVIIIIITIIVIIIIITTVRIIIVIITIERNSRKVKKPTRWGFHPFLAFFVVAFSPFLGAF